MRYALGYAAALAGLGAACWLPGYVLERLLFARRALGALRGLARLVLGLTAWMALVFVLAAAQLLQARALLAAAAFFALAAVVMAVARGRPDRPPPSAPPPARWRSAAVGVAAAALGAVLGPLFLLAVGPTVSWDADVYHLTLPRLYLEHGGFRPVAMSVYSNWPLGTELLFAAAMAVKDYVLAKLVHFGFGLLVLYALLAAARAEDRPAAGWLAMPLVLLNEVVVFELRVAYVDLAYAFFLLAGVLFVWRASALEAAGRRADAAAHLLLAGVCGGALAGVKVTGVIGAAVLAALVVPALLRAARGGRLGPALGGVGLCLGLPVAAGWLPWLAKSAWATGNPFYPFGWTLFGGPDWSAALGGQLAAWQRGIGMGRAPLDYLLAAAGLYFAAWAVSAQQMRFLIPILPLLALAAASAAVGVVARLRASPAARRAVLAAAFAASLAGVGITQARVMRAGLERLPIYARGDDLLAATVPPVYRFIDAELGADALILMLYTNHGFHCRRAYLADSFFEASQIADWLRPAGADVAALRRLLEARGVSHLLVAGQGWGIAFPPALPALLADPAAVEPLFRAADGSVTLFRLRSVAAGSGTV